MKDAIIFTIVLLIPFRSLRSDNRAAGPGRFFSTGKQLIPMQVPGYSL